MDWRSVQGAYLYTLEIGISSEPMSRQAWTRLYFPNTTTVQQHYDAAVFLQYAERIRTDDFAYRWLPRLSVKRRTSSFGYGVRRCTMRKGVQGNRLSLLRDECLPNPDGMGIT